MNILFFKKYITLIGVILMSGILVFYQIFFTDFSFTILSQNINQKIFLNTEKILKRRTVHAIIHADHDNLAMVAIRFVVSDPDKVDHIIFRIKEKGNKQIINEQRIRTTFINNKLFSFGFNPIISSKNKEYNIELESEEGTVENAVRISKSLPQIALRYKYTKSELKHPSNLKEFIQSKIKYKLSEEDILVSLIFSLFPILLYFIRDKNNSLNIFITVWTALDIFLMQEVYNILLLAFCLSLFLIYMYKKSITIFVIYASIYIFLGACAYYLHSENISTKLIYWSFLFFTIGLAVNLFQSFKINRK